MTLLSRHPPAYPAVITRTPTEVGDAIYLTMQVRCEATKRACDQLKERKHAWSHVDSIGVRASIACEARRRGPITRRSSPCAPKRSGPGLSAALPHTKT